MNVLCGYAIRATILALASWPLVGVLDHDKVVAQRQIAKICEDRAQPLYDAMRRRMVAQTAVPNPLIR